MCDDVHGLGTLELDAPRPHKRYTLRQLLLHRAGVPNYGGLEAYHEAVSRGEDAWPRERLFEAVNAERLDFEPGTRWNYSNVGYLFVRDAIEEAVSPEATWNATCVEAVEAGSASFEPRSSRTRSAINGIPSAAGF